VPASEDTVYEGLDRVAEYATSWATGLKRMHIIQLEGGVSEMEGGGRLGAGGVIVFPPGRRRRDLGFLVEGDALTAGHGRVTLPPFLQLTSHTRDAQLIPDFSPPPSRPQSECQSPGASAAQTSDPQLLPPAHDATPCGLGRTQCLEFPTFCSPPKKASEKRNLQKLRA
jgi:hypothetical protein